MDTIKLLRDYVSQHPDDSVAACALLDALQEIEGMTLRGAQTAVGRVRHAARTARLIARAVALLTRVGSAGARGRSIVRSGVSGTCPVSVPIDVVPGTRGPDMTGEPPFSEFRSGGRCRSPGAARRAGYKITYTRDTRRVTVGAQWVIEHCS